MTKGWGHSHLSSRFSPNFWDRLFLTSVASVKLHFRRPIIFLVVLFGSLTLFAMIAVLGRFEPGAGTLRAMFLPAPLDLFVHFQLGLVWAQPFLLIARVVFVLLVAGLVLQTGFKTVRMFRVGLVYLLGALCLIPILLLALYYVGVVASDPEGVLGLQRFMALALTPVLYTVVTALVAPMVGRAASGGRMRPVLGRASVWMLAAISAYLWTSVAGLARHPPANPFAVSGYVNAFMGLLFQSIIFGALILEGADRGPEEASPQGIN